MYIGIHSQGDPLAKAIYAVVILPLIHNPGVKHVMM